MEFLASAVFVAPERVLLCRHNVDMPMKDWLGKSRQMKNKSDDQANFSLFGVFLGQLFRPVPVVLSIFLELRLHKRFKHVLQMDLLYCLRVMNLGHSGG